MAKNQQHLGKPVVAQPLGKFINQGSRPVPNFSQFEFDLTIVQKGYDVIHEKAIACPCKDHSTQQPLSNCRNCGGNGWLFVNPLLDRMILTSINIERSYEQFGANDMGLMKVSAKTGTRFSHMDRLTIADGVSTTSQVRPIYLDADGTHFTQLTYSIKKINYVGIFVSPTMPLTRLLDNEYIIDGNRINFVGNPFGAELQNISITISYEHAPQFHIMDIGRDIMLTNVVVRDVNQKVEMPINAVARRAHYISDFELLNGIGLNNNSWLDMCDIRHQTQQKK